MPFIIDHSLCVRCGSCFCNCPNRAIIRKGEECYVTGMCSDCGVCIQYCPVGAIGKGDSKADLDNVRLDKALKEKLSLKKHIAAMKFEDKIPQGIPAEEGPQFWCGICGDIFEGQGKPVFFTVEATTCGGSSMIGLGSKRSSREVFDSVIDGMVVGEGNLYATRDLLAQGRDAFPLFPKLYKGIILGSLAQVKMPDLILFPVNGHQMCMISTAYAFDTGELIMGYAGTAACLMTVPIPLIENRAVFAIGDHGGRTHMRLHDEEFLACLPYRLVPGLVKNMDRTVYAQESPAGKD